jgi:hypothetical protein
MIKSYFHLSNPFRKNKFHNIRSWHRVLTKNMNVEADTYYQSRCLIMFDFEITARQDHAGARINLGLLSYCLELTVYDRRHYDSQHERWIN